MMRAAFAVALVACVAGCDDPAGVRAAVEAQGLTHVVTGGPELLGCGDDDSIRTGFEANDARGARVYGVVCEDGGLFAAQRPVVRVLGVLTPAPARPVTRR